MRTKTIRHSMARAGLTLMLALAMLVLALLALGQQTLRPVSAAGPTIINSDITADTTWIAADSPYRVTTTTVSIFNGAVLTIEPGVRVEFDDNAQIQVQNGRLIAIGTPAQPITFTSLSANPVRGSWEGISLNSLTSTIEYALMEYIHGGIQVNNSGLAPVFIMSNTIRYADLGGITGGPEDSIIAYNHIYSSNVGINIRGGTVNIFQNTIHDTDAACIRLRDSAGFGSTSVTADGNRLFDCGQEGIWLDGATNLGVTNKLINNVITNVNTSGAGTGAIYVNNQVGAVITGNLVYNMPPVNGSGLVFMWNQGFGHSATVNNNLFCVDGQYELENRSTIAQGALTAAGNWLGRNVPPPVTEIGEVPGTINYTPAITLSATPADAALPADGTSTTVVTIRMNDGAGHVTPPGTRDISLATDVGSLSASSVTLDGNGLATVTFTAPASFGTATITATEFCGYPVTATIQLQAADVAISKRAAISQVTPGGLITYTLTFTNNGNVTASGVVVTDTLPAEIFWVSDDGPGQGYPRTPASPTPADQVIEWAVGSLGPGAGGSITVVAQVRNVGSGGVSCTPGGFSLSNQAAIGTSTLDADLSNNTFTDSANGVNASIVCADVAISKIGPGGTVSPGQTVTYTIVYSNEGSAVAQGVVITDVNPVSGGIDTLVSGATLNPGDRFTIDYPVTTNAAICTGGAYLTNTATIATTTPETSAANNVATAGASTAPQIICYNLAVTKSTVIPWAVPGQVVTYTIDYSNTESYPAPDVVITDALPAQTSYVSDTSGFPVVVGAGVLTWTVSPNPLPAHSGGSFVLSAQIGAGATSLIPSPGVVTNTAFVAGSGGEQDLTDNSDDAVIPLRSGVNLAVLKDDGVAPTDPPVQATGFITYTINVYNLGNLTANNVVLTETVPANTTFVPGRSTPGWTLASGGVYTLSWASLAGTSGAMTGGITVTFVVQVAHNLSCAVNTTQNTATVGSSDVDLDAADNSATVQTPLQCNPVNLAISKLPATQNGIPGVLLTHIIAYTNTSVYPADNVVIRDVLPAYTNYISDTSGLTPITGTGVVTWSLGPVAPGVSGTFVLTTQIRSDAAISVCNQSLVNTVGITNTTGEADLSDNIATANIQVLCGVNLVVVKNDDIGLGATDVSPVAYAGQVFTYTINVVNAGTDPATNVVISETLPMSTTFVGPVGPQGWFHAGGRVYTYSVGAMAANGGASVKFQVMANFNIPPITTTTTNEVCVFSAGTDIVPSDNCDSVDTDLLGVQIDFELAKSDGNLLCAVPGQLIDYQIFVTNTTTVAAGGMWLNDFLPANTNFMGPVDGTWLNLGGGVYSHTLPIINGGQRNATPFWAEVDPAIPPSVTEVINTVRLEPIGLEASITTTINHTAPDLRIVKDFDPGQTLRAVSALEAEFGPVRWLKAPSFDAASMRSPQAVYVDPGDVVSYTIAAFNFGAGTSNNVVITETLPAHTTFLGPAYWHHLGGNTYIYTATSLAPQMGVWLDLRVRVNDPFPFSDFGNGSGSLLPPPRITNTVRIAGDELECVIDNNTDIEVTLVGQPQYNVYLPLILKPATPITTPTPTPAPTATPVPLPYVSDVAADPESNQVFVASPRHDMVYVIDSASDTIARTVFVGNGPTGLTVLSTTLTVPGGGTGQFASNKVFVAHQYGDNFWHPGVKAFGVFETVSHDTFDTGYSGAAPIRITSNPINNGRVYVSNYFDKLAVIDGYSTPPEARLGWVEQKAFQGAYGIDVSRNTGRVYLATRDTGELVVFDGNGDRLLQPDYIPTHIKPPEACSLWSVEVNEATGHVFVPCPQNGHVYVLDESQVSVLRMEELARIEKREGGLARVLEAADALWIASIDIPGATRVGEEGITLDPASGYVFMTNRGTNSVYIVRDGDSGTLALPAQVLLGSFSDPHGIDINRANGKVYVANNGSNTVTVFNAAPPFDVVKIINLYP